MSKKNRLISAIFYLAAILLLTGFCQSPSGKKKTTTTTVLYNISGTVSGLGMGQTVTLTNGADVFSNLSNGTFSIAQKVNDGTSYNIQVQSTTATACTAGKNVGMVNGKDVTDISVVCGFTTFSLSVLVSDAATLGAGLTFQNNGAADLPAALRSTIYTFSVPVVPGAPYTVTILTKPSGEICNANSAADVNGIMPNSNWTVNYTCMAVADPCLAGAGPKSLTVKWASNHSYDVSVAAGGGHKVYYDTVSPVSASYYLIVPNTLALSYATISGLKSGCTYYVKSVAYSAINPAGNYSPEVSIAVP